MNWKHYGTVLILVMIVGLGGGMVFGQDEDEHEHGPPEIVPGAKPALPPSILDEITRPKAAPTQEIVRAKKFELVDSKGRVRALFEMTPADEPRLVFADRAGKIQAMLSIEPVPRERDGIPALALFDKAGKKRIDIKLTLEGNPVISLHNKNGGHVASLSGWPIAEGGTEWLLSDEEGRVVVSLSINHAGANLIFSDKNRKMRARFGLKPDGSPGLVFSDETGKERAVLGYTEAKQTGIGLKGEKSVSPLALYDQDGEIIWKAP